MIYLKSSAEIRGLRIISISEGTQVGTVKELILNPQIGSLDFFIIDQPADYFGAKVIAFKDIVGLGEFALTVPNPSVVQDVSHNLEAQELLKQGVSVIGTKVLTKKGALIGEVQEILIDEETGKISVCIFTDNKGERHQVEGQQIITYGKELLIVDCDPDLGNKATTTANIIIEPQATAQDGLGEEVSQKHELGFQEEQQNEEFNLFEQRQLQYFIGKTVIQDIILDNGEVLSAGEPMTEETIRKIVTRSKLMEITSYLHKN